MAKLLVKIYDPMDNLMRTDEIDSEVHWQLEYRTFSIPYAYIGRIEIMPAQNKVPEHQKDAVYKAQQTEITRKKLIADKAAQQKQQGNNNRGGR